MPFVPGLLRIVGHGAGLVIIHVIACLHKEIRLLLLHASVRLEADGGIVIAPEILTGGGRHVKFL